MYSRLASGSSSYHSPASASLYYSPATTGSMSYGGGSLFSTAHTRREDPLADTASSAYRPLATKTKMSHKRKAAIKRRLKKHLKALHKARRA